MAGGRQKGGPGTCPGLPGQRGVRSGAKAKRVAGRDPDERPQRARDPGAVMDIRELLQFMVQQNISDIHFKANCAPLIRLHGRLISSQYEAITPQVVKDLAYSVMTDEHKKRF